VASACFGVFPPHASGGGRKVSRWFGVVIMVVATCGCHTATMVVGQKARVTLLECDVTGTFLVTKLI
jgi:hypothetical protein